MYLRPLQYIYLITTLALFLCLTQLTTISSMIVNQTMTISSSARFSSVFSFYFDKGGYLDMNVSLSNTNKYPITLMFCNSAEVAKIEASHLTFAKVCSTLPMGLCSYEVEIKGLEPKPTPTSSQFITNSISHDEIVHNDNENDDSIETILSYTPSLQEHLQQQLYNQNSSTTSSSSSSSSTSSHVQILTSPITNKQYIITHRYNNQQQDSSPTTPHWSLNYPVIHQNINQLYQHTNQVTNFVSTSTRQIFSLLQSAMNIVSINTTTQHQNDLQHKTFSTSFITTTDSTERQPPDYSCAEDDYDAYITQLQHEKDDIIYPDLSHPFASDTTLLHTFLPSLNLTTSPSLLSLLDPVIQQYNRSHIFSTNSTMTTLSTISQSQILPSTTSSLSSTTTPFHQIQQDDPSPIPDFKLLFNNTIPERSMYYILQLNCESIEYKLTSAYTAINPNGEHLSLNETPYKTVYTIFMYIFITTILILTFHYAYCYFTYGLPVKYHVYIPLLTILLCSTCQCYLSNLYWLDASQTGIKKLRYELIAEFFSVGAFFTYILFFISLSIGYSILRSTIPLITFKRMLLITTFISISRFSYDIGIGLGVLLHMLNLTFIWMIYLDGLKISITTLQLEIEVLALANLKLKNVLWSSKSWFSTLLTRRTNNEYDFDETTSSTTNTNNNNTTSSTPSNITSGIDNDDLTTLATKPSGKHLPIIEKLDMLLSIQHIAHIYILSSILLMIYHNSMGQFTGYVTVIGHLTLLLITVIRFGWTLRLRTDDSEALFILSSLYTQGTLTADTTEKVISAVKGYGINGLIDNNTLSTNNRHNNSNINNNSSSDLVSSSSHAALMRYHSNLSHTIPNDTNIDINSNNDSSSTTRLSSNIPSNYKYKWNQPCFKTKIVPPHILRFDSFEYNLLISMLKGGSGLSKNNITILFTPCQCFQNKKLNHEKTNFQQFLNFDGKYGLCPHTYLGLRWLTGINSSSLQNYNNGNNNSILGFGSGSSSSISRSNFLPGQAQLPSSSYPSPTQSPQQQQQPQQDSTLISNSSFSDITLASLSNDSQSLSPQQPPSQQQRPTSQHPSQFTSLNNFDTLTGLVSITTTSKKTQKSTPTNPQQQPISTLTTSLLHVQSGFYSTSQSPLPVASTSPPMNYNRQSTQQSSTVVSTSSTTTTPINTPPISNSPQNLTTRSTKNGLYHPFENQE